MATEKKRVHLDAGESVVIETALGVVHVVAALADAEHRRVDVIAFHPASGNVCDGISARFIQPKAGETCERLAASLVGPAFFQILEYGSDRSGNRRRVAVVIDADGWICDAIDIAYNPEEELHKVYPDLKQVPGYRVAAREARAVLSKSADWRKALAAKRG